MHYNHYNIKIEEFRLILSLVIKDHWVELSIISTDDSFDEISTGEAFTEFHVNEMNDQLKELESAVAEERTIQSLRKIHHIFHSILFQNCIPFEVETIETLFESKLSVKWEGHLVADDYPLNSHCGKMAQEAITKASEFIKCLRGEIEDEGLKTIAKITEQYIRVVCYG